MTLALPLPPDFNDFIGNTPPSKRLRTAIAAGRLPHSLILAGPAGAGKYTLALMLAMAVECERQPRDLWSNGQSLAGFCGRCSNCTRIASAANLEEQVAAAVAAREDLRETDKKDTRVLIQPHPDVLILPPDPPQLLIKLGQVRTLIQRAHYLPAEAPRTHLHPHRRHHDEGSRQLAAQDPRRAARLPSTSSSSPKTPASSCPPSAPAAPLVRLGALPVEEIEMLLADRRPEVPPKQRTLIARLAQGAAGRALGFDLEAYTAARADALLFLRNAAAAISSGGAEPDHTALFKMTETYRAGAEGQQKTTALLRAFSLLLEDLLLLSAGTPELLRNTDIRAELERLAAALPFAWIERASHALDQVQSGMRRNLLRSLSLDAFAAQLEPQLTSDPCA